MNAPSAPLLPDLAHLAAQLRALAHPVRLQVLATLAQHEACVCGEIVRGLPLAQSTVSQHIRTLADAGLIRGTVSGPRSCYCIDKSALAALREDLLVLFDALDGAAAGVPGDPSAGRAAASVSQK